MTRVYAYSDIDKPYRTVELTIEQDFLFYRFHAKFILLNINYAYHHIQKCFAQFSHNQKANTKVVLRASSLAVRLHIEGVLLVV